MKIKHMRTDAGLAGALARFTAEIGDVQLRNIMLRRNVAGGYYALPPTAFHKFAFVVQPHTWAEIEREAIALYESRCGGSVQGDQQHPGAVALDVA